MSCTENFSHSLLCWFGSDSHLVSAIKGFQWKKVLIGLCTFKLFASQWWQHHQSVEKDSDKKQRTLSTYFQPCKLTQVHWSGPANVALCPVSAAGNFSTQLSPLYAENVMWSFLRFSNASVLCLQVGRLCSTTSRNLESRDLKLFLRKVSIYFLTHHKVSFTSSSWVFFF